VPHSLRREARGGESEALGCRVEEHGRRDVREVQLGEATGSCGDLEEVAERRSLLERSCDPVAAGSVGARLKGVVALVEKRREPLV
jgi:hypothetical protein